MAISSNISSAPRFQSHAGAGSFGTVTGEFEHEVVLGGAGGEPHARMEINAAGKQYEADINVHSIKNPDGSPGGSDVEYAIQDHVVPSMPQDGVQMGTKFSYQQAGLKESDFKPVDGDQFHTQLETLAKGSEKVQLTGMTYSNGPNNAGIHDIHMNSGEKNASMDHPGEDGLVRFYNQENGQIHEKTVFIKFQSQTLPDGSNWNVAQ